jgi:phosphoribosylamine--glycine ligase
LKILVIGSGGREHALVQTFCRQGHEVYSCPGNPGIWALAPPLEAPVDDYAKLMQAVKKKGIDLTVVGPEVHLERGIQDVFEKEGLALFGPSKQAARLETSKAFAKEFMARHKIPTARFEICSNPDAAKRFLKEGGVVIKASGLAGGKGVTCCKTFEEAEGAIGQIRSGEIVIEELLEGPELSLQCIVDGERIIPLLAARDHKRLYDGDQGPNTGGMGAFAPLPLDKEILRTIALPTLAGLKKDGVTYRGILYFGLMLTKTGPKLLEYNCRFGDPEAQVVLPLLESNLAELMIGPLPEAPLRWSKKASTCVVLAAKGYPMSPVLGAPIGEMRGRDDLFFFHAGTRLADNKLVTAGGRVIGVTALGNNLEDARRKAYAAIDLLQTPWAHFRRDIGQS